MKTFVVMLMCILSTQAEAGILKNFCNQLLLGPVPNAIKTREVLPQVEVQAPPTPPARPLVQHDQHVKDRGAYEATQTPEVRLKKALDKIKDIESSSQLPKEIVAALKNQSVMALDSRLISFLVHAGRSMDLIKVDGLQFARTDQGLFDYISSYLMSSHETASELREFIEYLMTSPLGREAALNRPDVWMDLMNRKGIEPVDQVLILFKWLKLSSEKGFAREKQQALSLMKRYVSSILPKNESAIAYHLYKGHSHPRLGFGSETALPYFELLEKLTVKLASQSDKVLLFSLLENTLSSNWVYLMNALYKSDFERNYSGGYMKTYRHEGERQSFAQALNYYSFGVFLHFEVMMKNLEGILVFEKAQAADVRSLLRQFRVVHSFIRKKKIKPKDAYVYAGLTPEKAMEIEVEAANEQYDDQQKAYLESGFQKNRFEFQRKVLMNPSILMSRQVSPLLAKCRSHDQASCLFDQFMAMTNQEFEGFFAGREVIVSEVRTADESRSALGQSLLIER